MQDLGNTKKPLGRTQEASMKPTDNVGFYVVPGTRLELVQGLSPEGF